jgi:hypothetical protein
MPLSVQELQNRLDAEGISPSAYSIGPTQKDNCLCLVEESTGWRIFFVERGEEDNIAISPTFTEASRHFLEILLNDTAAR